MPILVPPRAALIVAAVAALGVAACSFVVESRDRQCESDADCGGFDDAVCDVAGGVCVPRESAGPTSTGPGGGGGGGTGSTSTGCVGPDGCYACAPDAQEEFLNGCTDAECIPYDNAQLEGLLQEDGSVPPIP